MDGLGDQLLPRARLALDEDGRIGGRGAADHLVDLLHRGGLADDQLVALLELATEPLEVARQTAELHGAADEDLDLVEVERLGQVVIGAALGGLDGIGHRVLRGHDDEERVDMVLACARQHLEAREVRHADVDQRHVVRALTERRERLAAAADGMDSVAVLGTRALAHPADRLLVVRDEDDAGRRRDFIGWCRRHRRHSRAT